MRASNLVTAAAISVICYSLPLLPQEPQVAGPQSPANSPLFLNPFASQPQEQPVMAPRLKVMPSATTPVLQTKPKVCAIPLLNGAPKDAAHYTMPTVSPRRDVDPRALTPSMPACGSDSAAAGVRRPADPPKK